MVAAKKDAAQAAFARSTVFHGGVNARNAN
jgi:hypothetical protein